jgi:hypothetical protein
MVWVVNATPWPLYPRERRGTHSVGGWVDPRAGLDGYGKSRPPPRTVKRVAIPTELSRSSMHQYAPNPVCHKFTIMRYTTMQQYASKYYAFHKVQ